MWAKTSSSCLVRRKLLVRPHWSILVRYSLSSSLEPLRLLPTRAPHIATALLLLISLFQSKKAVIVTASHCLSRPFMAPSNLTISITYLGDDVIHDCSVLYHQAPPEDSSILTCPGLTNLIGLVSSGSSRLSQSVAITGFAVDTFNSSSKKTSSKTRSHHVPFSHFNSSFALNVDFSRIVSVAGPPHKLKDGSLCVSSPSEDVWDVNPSGFVERQVREGMSGGPILDLKCGVVGISHGRSCNAGAYVDLTSVDLYIESMKSI